MNTMVVIKSFLMKSWETRGVPGESIMQAQGS